MCFKTILDIATAAGTVGAVIVGMYVFKPKWTNA